MQQPATANIPVHLVNRPDTLQPCLHHLERHDTLSFDIEFDNNSYGYGVTLCLLQVATPTACYVIDGLAGLDLGPLYALFGAATVQKIVHASGEDLRLLHSLGCFPKNLYDTEVAARLLNYEQTSISVLLQEKLSVSLDKKQQRSNWLRRPLTEAQVQYAAEDVIWLHPLKKILEEEAGERGLLRFVQEEQERLDNTTYPVADKTTFLRPADLYNLSPQAQYITNQLLCFRDGLARRLNQPPYRVMSEDLVRELAAGTRLPESLAESRDVHPRFRNRRFVVEVSKELEQARKAAANLSPQRGRRPRPTPDQQAGFRATGADKETVFAPIKLGLEERFGVHAATFMLSNKLVGNLLNGTLSLQDLPPYRQALIREVAAEKGISLDAYLGTKPNG